MNRTDEVKQERSVVVSARVDVTDLADIFAAIQARGRLVRSMSGLIAYCVDIAHSALEGNGYIENRIGDRPNGLEVAYNTLKDYGLIKGGMERRNIRKMTLAMGFERLRNDFGVDPKYDEPLRYKQLHNEHSVQPPKPMLRDDALLAKQVEIYHELEQKQMMDEAEVRSKAAIEAAKARADENGLIRAIPAQTNVFEAPTPSVRPKLGRPPKAVEPLNECQIVQSSEVPVSYEDRKKSPEMYDRWKRQEQMRMAAAVKSVGQQSDMPRKKTDAEIEADALRIAQKDRELAEMDMSAPKGSMNQVD